MKWVLLSTQWGGFKIGQRYYVVVHKLKCSSDRDIVCLFSDYDDHESASARVYLPSEYTADELERACKANCLTIKSAIKESEQ